MLSLSQEDLSLLDEICARHGVQKQVVLELLQTEDDLADMGRRHGLYERIGEILDRATRNSASGMSA
jgi:hypothetical protein